jgi:DNA-binding CsgD family transcriptional regulator
LFYPLAVNHFTNAAKRKQIYELLLTGIARKEIAARLHLSESAVKYHEMRIFHEFGVHTRLELLAKHLKKQDQ